MRIAKMEVGYLKSRFFATREQAVAVARQINKQIRWPKHARAIPFGSVWTVAIYENASKDAFVTGYLE